MLKDCEDQLKCRKENSWNYDKYYERYKKDYECYLYRLHYCPPTTFPLFPPIPIFYRSFHSFILFFFRFVGKYFYCRTTDVPYFFFHTSDVLMDNYGGLRVCGAGGGWYVRQGGVRMGEMVRGY